MDANKTIEDRNGGAGVMVLAAGLMTIGTVMILSASAGIERPLFGDNWLRSTWMRQVGFALLGLLAMLVVSQI